MRTLQSPRVARSIFLSWFSRQDWCHRISQGTVEVPCRSAQLHHSRAVCAKKNSSTPSTSDTTADKGAVDKKIKTLDIDMSHKSESRQHKDMKSHRLSINWWCGSKKNQFLTSLMTSSVRNPFSTIGLGVFQDTIMSTKRTLNQMTWFSIKYLKKPDYQRAS